MNLFLIFIKGFLFSLSLISAIGAQNAFVLKQGIAKNNVFLVCLICVIGDFLLMGAGIFGVGKILGENKILMLGVGIFGILFVMIYGFSALLSALRGSTAQKFNSENTHYSLKKSVLLTLGVTFLNPHCYLDTIFMMGAVTMPFLLDEKTFFWLGCVSASGVWFFTLGFFAQKFSRALSSPKILRIIDFFIAMIMAFVAFTIVKFMLLELH